MANTFMRRMLSRLAQFGEQLTEAPSTLKEARSTFIEVYSPEDVRNYFGYSYSPEEKAALELIPFGRKALKRRSEDFILFPGCPMTIDEMESKFRDKGLLYNPFGILQIARNEPKQPFAAEERVPVRWHLIRKEPMALPAHMVKIKNGLVAVELLEELPHACTLAQMWVFHKLHKKESLFIGARVETADYFFEHIDAKALLVGNTSSVCTGTLGKGAQKGDSDCLGFYRGWWPLGMEISIHPERLIQIAPGIKPLQIRR